MTELTIYDRFGDPVSQDGDSVGRYERFDRRDVLVYVETTGSKPMLVSAFRAHDRPGGRSNRFFAVFRGGRVETVFEDCRRAVERRVEELGWRLDTSSDNDRVHTFRALSEIAPEFVDIGTRREHVVHLLRTGRRADFEVRDVLTGVAVLKQFVRDENLEGSFALGNNGRVPEMDDALLVVQPGAAGVGALRPLGATEAALEDAREDWEARVVDDQLDEITETLVDGATRLRERATLRDDELRDQLIRAVNSAFDRTGVDVEATRRASYRGHEPRADGRRNGGHATTAEDSSVFSGRLSGRSIAVIVGILLVLAFAAGAMLSPPLVAGVLLPV